MDARVAGTPYPLTACANECPAALRLSPDSLVLGGAAVKDETELEAARRRLQRDFGYRHPPARQRNGGALLCWPRVGEPSARRTWSAASAWKGALRRESARFACQAGATTPERKKLARDNEQERRLTLVEGRD